MPLTADANTVALYHFDEQTSGNCTSGTVITDADGNASPGECRFGGSPGGPVWSTDSPFAAGPSAGTLQFSSGSATVAESAPSVTLNVTRTGGTSGAVGVSYASANGTATAGSDYTAVNDTLSWASGDGASKSITVPIIEDTAAEGDQTFTVSLSGPTNGATLGTALATVTIDDNDAPGTVQLSAASYAAAEGTPTQSHHRSAPQRQCRAATVQYATNDGTAIQGQDYTTATGTLQWNAGETGDRTFNVTIADDSQVESAETFTITLSNQSGASLGTPSSATVTISDNDSTSPPPSNSDSGGGGTLNAAFLLLMLVLLASNLDALHFRRAARILPRRL